MIANIRVMSYQQKIIPIRKRYIHSHVVHEVNITKTYSLYHIQSPVYIQNIGYSTWPTRKLGTKP